MRLQVSPVALAKVRPPLTFRLQSGAAGLNPEPGPPSLAPTCSETLAATAASSAATLSFSSRSSRVCGAGLTNSKYGQHVRSGHDQATRSEAYRSGQAVVRRGKVVDG